MAERRDFLCPSTKNVPDSIITVAYEHYVDEAFRI